MDFSHTRGTSTASVMSPTTSIFSKGHSSKSSQSSISASSSPIPTRDSFDVVHLKKLEDVREEADPYEYATREHCSFDDYMRNDSGISLEHRYHTYSAFRDQDAWSTTSSGRHHSKRQRSMTGPGPNTAHGIVSRFGSLSRRWRNRSTASSQSLNIGPHSLTAGHSACEERYTNTLTSPLTGSLIQDFMPPSPIMSIIGERFHDSEVVPIGIDNLDASQGQEVGSQHATTPLLPPLMMGPKKHDSPFQSPLQSPSIAPANQLPSPPLSSRPSIGSMHHPRSKQNTNTDVPPLYLYGEDRWAMSLGHADFTIHPEPYSPENIDVDSYTEFRANWTQARKLYAQHLARTVEHYGDNSKVFKLTEEKWRGIDDCWKRYDSLLTAALSPSLQRLNGETSGPQSPIYLLEKPATRVVVPPRDSKWPELGDNDIVGPMCVVEAKAKELQREQSSPSTTPRRRSLMRAITHILTRH